MKILTLSAVFPPKIIGGAEISAYNLALWLAREGHEVGVLTVSESKSDELHGEHVDGLRIWRLLQPRSHTHHTHKQKTPLGKLIWHLQDHLDPRNAVQLRKIIDDFKPDAINVHVLQGLGHNSLSALRGLDIPVLYFLHDLTLACFRQGMYRNSSNCASQCKACALSSSVKVKHLLGLKQLDLISPSKSNLDTLGAFVDIGSFRSQVMANLDLEDAVDRQPGSRDLAPRFLYVGRLDETKGVDFLLQVLDGLATRGRDFTMTVVGGGPVESALRQKYAGRPWLTFTGKIEPSKVGDFFKKSDLLLLPSLWRENHPGVIRQALRAGIPCVVSDSGGSKEMIREGESGLVLPAGDEIAWMNALESLTTNREKLFQLENGARAAGHNYSADVLGEAFLALISRRKSTVQGTRPTSLIELAGEVSKYGSKAELPAFQDGAREVTK